MESAVELMTRGEPVVGSSCPSSWRPRRRDIAGRQRRHHQSLGAQGDQHED